MAHTHLKKYLGHGVVAVEDGLTIDTEVLLNQIETEEKHKATFRLMQQISGLVVRLKCSAVYHCSH